MTTATKERPILFSGPMVRAILAGRKTQTRRVVKPQPPQWATVVNEVTGLNALGQHRSWGLFSWSEAEQNPPRRLRRWPQGEWGPCSIPCPYGVPGDRLWVRETWCYRWNDDDKPVEPEEFLYRATFDGDDYLIKWCPSIHMPRRASRLTLEVTGVRVERLQSMSHNDWKADFCPTYQQVDRALATFVGMDRQKEMAKEFWDSINAARGFGWDSSPWVWVVEFKRVTD